ncbi:MAG: hypothetical protein PWQ67_1861 [Clostridia bacterium]|nr:hypothetical protein [Clostridia bacterium]MDN5323407.1 hypothetical protein [Clostridia bacterium]
MIKSIVEGYAVSSQIKKILDEEGYVVLRIVSENAQNIKICETLKIKEGVVLPEGADTILTKQMVCDYGNLIVLEKDFQPFVNIIQEEQ